MQHYLMGKSIPRRLDAGTAANSDNISISCPSSTSNNLDPSSFGYYDAIYDHVESNDFAASSRVGSVEVVPPIITDTDLATNQTYAIMRFIAINGMSATHLVDGEETLVARGNGGSQIYGDLSGMMLGMHHFNNGIGRVVQEVTDIHKRCPVRFSVEDLLDDEASQSQAVYQFNKQIFDNQERPPSGLIGSTRSAVSVPLAIMSGTYDIPQISPLSTSSELDDTNKYRYFSRLIPSDAGTAQAVVDYLAGLGVRHLGMLYVNDPYGSAYHQAIVEAARSRPESDQFTVKGSPFSYSNNDALSHEAIDLEIKYLAATGYRYFFGVFYDEHYEAIMEDAFNHGIAGTDNVWIFSDGISETYLDGRTYKTGSNLAIASQGIGILKAEGGRETANGDSGYDRFTEAWYDQGLENINYYNCKQPKDNTDNDPSIYFKGPPTFFTDKQLSPTAGAVYTYDSVMALGLAACDLYQENGEAYFNGEELFNGFVSQSFEGASGRVRINPDTTSRDPKSAFFVLYNANGLPDGKGGTVFSVKTAAHSAPNPESAGVLWVSYKDEEYLYADGTANPPDSIPPAQVNLNQLTIGVRAAGLTVTAIIFLLALFFGVWTKKNCKKRVVKASQPEFLYMILLGTVVLGSTIIPLSYDDSVASARGCDMACMFVPWLFNYGFITVFSALFAKTWRLNRIMENLAAVGKKMKVTRMDAMRPFFVLLVINTIVLVTWTKVDPLIWTRVDTGVYDSFDRPIDSYGVCSSDNIFAYVVPLFLANFSVVIRANYQAYRARNLSTEFSESKYISIIMASVFQAIVVGLPLSVLVAKDPAASFIVLTCIIGALSLSPLCFMFIPKVMAVKEQLLDVGNIVPQTGGQGEEEEEEENLNNNEITVERANITQVKADLGSENVEEGGILMRIWGGAKEIYHHRMTGEITNDEEEGNNVISSKSIFVGTLVQRRE